MLGIARPKKKEERAISRKLVIELGKSHSTFVMVRKRMKRNKIDFDANALHNVLVHNLCNYVIMKICKHEN